MMSGAFPHLGIGLDYDAYSFDREYDPLKLFLSDPADLFGLPDEAFSHQRNGLPGRRRNGEGAEHPPAYVPAADYHDSLPDFR